MSDFMKACEMYMELAGTPFPCTPRAKCRRQGNGVGKVGPVAGQLAKFDAGRTRATTSV